MNRTLKEATVRRYHCDSHDQLRKHLAAFLAAYNFAKRLKTLRGLTPHEYICKCWTENPDQFRLNPKSLCGILDPRCASLKTTNCVATPIKIS